MQYFVISPNGQKYGPADVQTLNTWVQEGRVVSTSMLEDAATGQIIPVDQVPGLVIVPATPNYQNPHAQYPRGQMVGGFDNGESDLRTAWTFAIIGVVCSFVIGICCSFFSLFNIFSILGLVYCSNAKKKGNPNTQNALICSITGIVIGPAIWVILLIVARSFRWN